MGAAHICFCFTPMLLWAEQSPGERRSSSSAQTFQDETPNHDSGYRRVRPAALSTAVRVRNIM